MICSPFLAPLRAQKAREDLIALGNLVILKTNRPKTSEVEAIKQRSQISRNG